jgi:type IV secretion system protein VirB10
MRTRLVLLVLLLAPAGAFAADIPQGTHVLLRMTNSLSTRTAREGDQVYFQTASPIAADGRILVPVGSYVQGTVSESKRSGKVSGRAELAIHLDTLMLASGKTMKFSPHLASADSNGSGQKVEGNEGAVKQAPGHGQDAGRVAIWAGSGAAVGGLAEHSWSAAGIGGAAGGAVGLATVLLTRGREVELRTGSTLDVVFDRPLEIE